MSAGKVVPLDEAVRAAVRPSMSLHFAFTHNRPAAAMAEILRQFYGTGARFDVAHLFTAGPAVALLTAGLVRRLTTTLLCEPYPAPGPSRAARRAHRQGLFDVSWWSVLSYVARLRAAATGLPWLPVRSEPGCTLWRDNQADVRVRDDERTVEVSALCPDLSFVHAPAADPDGNVLLAPPLGEGTWGALAAREGIVVTVERLVDRETLRRHAHLPGLPSSHVRSVSVVPFGAHPAGLAAGGIDGVEPYGDDVDFYRDGRRAARSAEDWQAWTDRWLREPPDRDAYLSRLGAARILALKGKARPDSWRPELLEARADPGLDAPATRIESMIVAAARVLERKVRTQGHRAILSGLGAGNLAAWLTQTSAGSEPPPALVAELGLYGYDPRPCDPWLFNFRNLATCTQQSGSETTLGALTGGPQARCLGSLGAAQVDRHGNLNSTRLEDGTLLVGSGGAHDVAASAREVVVTMAAGRERLVESLPYTTCAGRRTTAVVTDLGIFEKPPGDAPLRLTRLVGPLIGEDPAEHIAALRARCGFEVEPAPDLGVEDSPPPDVLTRLRLFDPDRFFLGPLPQVTGPERPTAERPPNPLE